MEKHTIEGTRRKSQKEIENFDKNYQKSFDGKTKPVKGWTYQPKNK